VEFCILNKCIHQHKGRFNIRFVDPPDNLHGIVTAQQTEL